MGKKIRLYDELVVDVTGFEHPGSTSILDRLEPNVSIKPLFEKQGHSYSAQVLVARFTIGQTK